MRFSIFARLIFAVTAFGLVMNSGCAADHKKTPVNRHGGGGPVGSGGGGDIAKITNISQVEKTNTEGCPSSGPISKDGQTMQPTLDKITSLGTPITYDQLPIGGYRLVKVIGNLQASNLPGGTFDVYHESDIAVNDIQVTDTCTNFSYMGKAPNTNGAQLDKGRSFTVDNYFDIGDKGLNRDDVGEYDFIIGANPSTSKIGVSTLSPTEIQKLADAQKQLAAIQNPNRKQTRLSTTPAVHIPSPIKAFFHKKSADQIVDATQHGLYPGATGSSQLYKTSDSQYTLEITFNEPANADVLPVRKVILVYGFTSTAPTTKAGGMNAPSITNKDGSTITSAPAPSETTPSGSTATPPPAAPVINQQPPQSQQDIDKAAKDAAATAAAPAQAAPAAPAPATPPAAQAAPGSAD